MGSAVLKPNNGTSGGAGESRTPDTQFRKLLLYPSELQPHSNREFYSGLVNTTNERGELELHLHVLRIYCECAVMRGAWDLLADSTPGAKRRKLRCHSFPNQGDGNHKRLLLDDFNYRRHSDLSHPCRLRDCHQGVQTSRMIPVGRCQG